MKNQGRYRHLRVDWVGESSSESITLCGVEGEDIGTGQTLCPDCAQVADALHVCGLGPESLRELFDTQWVFCRSTVRAPSASDGSKLAPESFLYVRPFAPCAIRRRC